MERITLIPASELPDDQILHIAPQLSEYVREQDLQEQLKLREMDWTQRDFDNPEAAKLTIQNARANMIKARQQGEGAQDFFVVQYGDVPMGWASRTADAPRLGGKPLPEEWQKKFGNHVSAWVTPAIRQHMPDHTAVIGGVYRQLHTKMGKVTPSWTIEPVKAINAGAQAGIHLDRAIAHEGGMRPVHTARFSSAYSPKRIIRPKQVLYHTSDPKDLDFHPSKVA